MVTLTKAEKAKVERCVKRMKSRRNKVRNPHAVCTASVLKQRKKRKKKRSKSKSK